MHEPSVLFHVSEDAGIERFDPRASASSSADAPPRPRSQQALGIPRSTDPHGSERWGVRRSQLTVGQPRQHVSL